jgi:prepilin-type N-terminal cleavage/methylation domain-containing protein
MGLNPSEHGYSLIESMFVVALVAILGSVASAQFFVALDEFRVVGAVRHVSARLQMARMASVARLTNVAVRFTRSGSSYVFAVYEDGNENGVLTRDIQLGIDRQVQPPERLPDNFVGVDFGVLPNLPSVDPSGSPPGSDPIRLGSSDMVSFTALGTSTSGTLYVRNRRHGQYAVRIFGETGKTRLLKFDARRGLWISL